MVVAWSRSIEISDKSTAVIAAVRSSIRARCAHCFCWTAGLWCCRKLEVSMLCALLLLLLSGRWPVLRTTTHTNVPRDLGQPGGNRMKNIWQAGECADGRLRQTQPVTAVLCIWMCRKHTACGRQRWNADICACLCMLSVVYRVYIRAVCSQLMRAYNSRRGENRQHATYTYVQNNAFPIETREIVLSTPVGKIKSSARLALQSARNAPRPRRMCLAGLPVSDYLVL